MLPKSLLVVLLVMVLGAVNAIPIENEEVIEERAPRVDTADGEADDNEEEELYDGDDSEDEGEDVSERSIGTNKIFHGFLSKFPQVKVYRKHGKTFKIYYAFGGKKHAMKDFHKLHLKKYRPWKGKHNHGLKGKFGHYRVHLREGGLYKKPVLSFRRKHHVYSIVYQ